MTCGVGVRCGSDLALLWLWCRLVATSPIQPLAWKPPYAGGCGPKRDQKKKKKKDIYFSGLLLLSGFRPSPVMNQSHPVLPTCHPFCTSCHVSSQLPLCINPVFCFLCFRTDAIYIYGQICPMITISNDILGNRFSLV